MSRSSDISKKRSQFKVALLTEDVSVLQAEASISDGLGGNGYDVQVFSAFSDFAKELPVKPPHVAVLDIRSLEGRVLSNLQKVQEVSPETVFLLVVDEVDQGVEFGSEVYEFLLRAVFRGETFLSALDRACEKVFHVFRSEQLLARLQKAEGIADKSFQEETPDHASKLTSDIVGLSAVPIIDEKTSSALVLNLMEELKLCKTPKDGLQCVLDTFHENVEAVPTLFFRYISSPSSLMLSQGVGLSMDEVRGAGVRFESSFYSQEELAESDEVKRALGELVTTAFKAEKFSCFNLRLDGLGILVVLKDFETIQGRDLFFTFLRLLESHLEQLKISFQLHGLQRFSPITGLLNRECFAGDIVEELARARRIRQPVSLVTLSIDSFGEYRRRAGEALAEKVLMAVAEVLKNTSRTNDVNSDFGEGEFALLLPHTGQEGAVKKAEKIRRIINSASFPRTELIEAKKLTLSLGVSEYPKTSKDADSLLASADDALFYIRKGGGNQVCAAAPLENFRPDFEPNFSNSL